MAISVRMSLQWTKEFRNFSGDTIREKSYSFKHFMRFNKSVLSLGVNHWPHRTRRLMEKTQWEHGIAQESSCALIGKVDSYKRAVVAWFESSYCETQPMFLPNSHFYGCSRFKTVEPALPIYQHRIKVSDL